MTTSIFWTVLKMRISGLYSADLQNGPGVGVTLGTAGCHKRCKGCFNSQFWNLNSGIEYTSGHKKQILKLISKPYIDHFSVIGGEPLIAENLFELDDLTDAIKLKRPDIKIWIWSGYTWEEILNAQMLPNDGSVNSLTKIDNLEAILYKTDYLVDGPFIQELADSNLLWRGSANQRIIDVQSTINQIRYVENYTPIVYS